MFFLLTTRKHRYAHTVIVIIIVVMLFGCKKNPVSQSSLAGSSLTSNEENSREYGWIPLVWKSFLANGPAGRELPDFSYAGYAMGERPVPEFNGPVYDVTHPGFGAAPDDGIDDTKAIQKAIETAETNGGGVVFLPKGHYDVHSTPDIPHLRITHSHVILRGEGSTETGTLLHLGLSGPDRIVNRLGFIPAEQEARSYAAISVQGEESRKELALYTGDVTRGNRLIKVTDSSRLSQGQFVSIDFTDNMIDPASPHPEKTDLAAQLASPFRFTEAQTESFGPEAATHTWFTAIREIIDQNTILLSKPARFDQMTRYNPRIYSFEGVKEVGIEHLRIQSSWSGGYRHHKPFLGHDGAVVRTAKEQDYLWNGIWFSFAVNSWVKNVVFQDLTQGIIVSKSANMTIEDIKFKGCDGHAGITIAHSHDILVNRAEFTARMIHPVTLKNHASGNVITNAKAFYDGEKQVYGPDAAMDFHGLSPYENLFEDMQGFYICPGGDVSVLPHAGVRNVFWNISAPENMSCYTGSKDDEFARSENWRYTSSGTSKTMFEHFPQAFYIGITRKGCKKVTVAGSGNDRKTPWFTIEGMNREGIGIPSLYRAQLSHRLGR